MIRALQLSGLILAICAATVSCGSDESAPREPLDGAPSVQTTADIGPSEPTRDAGKTGDAASASDAGSTGDADTSIDAGRMRDAGGTSEAGRASEAGTTVRSSDASADGAAVDAAYRPCTPDGTPCRIMPFGDSITDGYNPDTPGGYRVELFRLLHEAGKNVTFVGSVWNGPDQVDGVPFPHNHEGHSGWTIAPAGSRSGISTLVSTVMPQHRPHVVLLMIGTNDAVDNYDMAHAPSRLGALIDSIYTQLPSVLIIVARPIPARGDVGKGDDPALNARIDAFGDAISAVVRERADAGKHILAIDTHTPFLSDTASLLADPWHPNRKGYALLGETWFSALKPLL
jgi:lysophospholipase L1-like esterase